MKRHFVRFVMLLEHDAKAHEFLDSMFQNGVAIMDDTDRTFTLIENWISEYPLHVEVDHEVWRSFDKHSRDKWALIVTLGDATVTDDVLEDLPDEEAHVDAAVWVVRNNEWIIELREIF